MAYCRPNTEQIAVRVIGVIDIRDGQAVHAQGGQRKRYRPVELASGRPVHGDAVALGRIYLDLGVPELYIADLDAIGGRETQDAVIERLTSLGAPVWLDAGVSSVDGARRATELGAANVIVGLETLVSWNALRKVCEAVGGNRVAFSLDLWNGAPIFAQGARAMADDSQPEGLVARAAASGVGCVIVLDLARVGRSSGFDQELLARIRRVTTRGLLVAGGGVRGTDDLERLASAGCDGALVATALHRGALSAQKHRDGETPGS